MPGKILVSRGCEPDALALIPKDFEVDLNGAAEPLSRAELVQRLRGTQGLICQITDTIDDEILAAATDLKVVSNIAVGYNNIDVPACTARGVRVTNTPGVLDDSTADLAWTLLLATARRLTEAEAYVRAGNWHGWHLKQLLGVDVHHATLGVIGMGRIGQQIVRRAAGFKMRVLYHNRNRLPADVEKWLNAEYATKEQLLAQADFVVLQVPYSPATHHYIGAAELKLMKPTAILINSTRGGVVNDAALIAALKNGTIRAAGLDVFENEPKLNPGFLELKNVVLAPHVGSSTEATRRAMAMTAAKNAVAVLTGGTPPNLLNPEAKNKA
jgi:lactate dehydrogenase-like 2-hydroxyacid dehydrogenase